MSLLCAAGLGGGAFPVERTSNPGGAPPVWTAAATSSPMDGHPALGACWSPSLQLFVVVGEEVASFGTLITSPDTVTWATRGIPSGFTTPRCVTWSATLGLFVAAGLGLGGSPVLVLTSPDGATWTPRTTPWDAAGAVVNGVCWSATLGLFVAVGQSASGGHVLMTSPNGTTWTTRATPFDTGGALNGVADDGAGNLVAVGADSGGTHVVATSADGVTWTARTDAWSGTKVGHGVAYHGGLWVVVGSGSSAVQTSPDGITWTARTSPWDAVGLLCVAYSPDDSVWVAGGNPEATIGSTIGSSTSGTSGWTIRDASGGTFTHGVVNAIAVGEIPVLFARPPSGLGGALATPVTLTDLTVAPGLDTPMRITAWDATIGDEGVSHLSLTLSVPPPSKPAVPSQLYLMQLLTDLQSQVQALGTGVSSGTGKTYATVVVAAHNTRIPAADFVCAGFSDEATINEAIGALPPEGGKVLLLEGNYVTAAPIVIDRSNMTLEGMGPVSVGGAGAATNGTVIQGSLTNTAADDYPLLVIRNRTFQETACLVRGVNFQSNAAISRSGPVGCINLDRTGSGRYIGTVIEDCGFLGSQGALGNAWLGWPYAIYASYGVQVLTVSQCYMVSLGGIHFGNGGGLLILNDNQLNSTGTGIEFPNGCFQATISGNSFLSVGDVTDYSPPGAQPAGACISGHDCGGLSIVGNTLDDSQGPAILFTGLIQSSIVNNTMSCYESVAWSGSTPGSDGITLLAGGRFGIGEVSIVGNDLSFNTNGIAVVNDDTKRFSGSLVIAHNTIDFGGFRTAEPSYGIWLSGQYVKSGVVEGNSIYTQQKAGTFPNTYSDGIHLDTSVAGFLIANNKVWWNAGFGPPAGGPPYAINLAEASVTDVYLEANDCNGFAINDAGTGTVRMWNRYGANLLDGPFTAADQVMVGTGPATWHLVDAASLLADIWDVGTGLDSAQLHGGSDLAAGAHSVAEGYGALAYEEGMVAQASNRLRSSGDAQRSVVTACVSTTDATPTPLANVAGSRLVEFLTAGATADWLRTAAFDVTVVGRKTNGAAGGTWLAIGSDSATGKSVMTSLDDGVTWTPQTTPFDGGFIGGAAWSPSLNLWVAVGNDSTFSTTVMTSPDGVTWTVQTTPWDSGGGSPGGGEDVVWDGTQFVMTGADPTLTQVVMTSPDGLTWTVQTTAFDGAGGFAWRIAWNGSLFVVGGNDPTNTYFLMTSPDGVTWTGRSSSWSTAGFVDDIAWSPSLGLWAVVGYSGGGTTVVTTSPDGITWTAGVTPLDGPGVQLLGVMWDPVNLLFVTGAGTPSGQGMTSPDGITWTTMTVGGAAGHGTRAFASDGVGVSFVGLNFPGTGTPVQVIQSSPDDVTWGPVTTPWDGDATGAIVRNLRFAPGVTPVNDVSAWKISGLLTGDGSSHGYRFVGSPSVTLIAQDAGASTWAVAVALSGHDLLVDVTGEAATDIDWNAVGELTEVRA